MAGPTIRDATADDAAAIAALQVRSWKRAYRGIAPDDYLDELTDDTWLERWDEDLSDQPDEGFHQLVSCRQDDERPVAVAVAGPARDAEDDLTAQLYLLYADPDAWGQGHGSALLREVHHRLDEDGHARAQLWVAAENARTIAIYEHHGWRRDGTRDRGEVHGVEIDEVRMVRDLP